MKGIKETRQGVIRTSRCHCGGPPRNAAPRNAAPRAPPVRPGSKAAANRDPANKAVAPATSKSLARKKAPQGTATKGKKPSRPTSYALVRRSAASTPLKLSLHGTAGCSAVASAVPTPASVSARASNSSGAAVVELVVAAAAAAAAAVPEVVVVPAPEGPATAAEGPEDASMAAMPAVEAATKTGVAPRRGQWRRVAVGGAVVVAAAALVLSSRGGRKVVAGAVSAAFGGLRSLVGGRK